ncbi:glycosyltransferase family 2 protein [Halorhabdus sp. CUG00001]|uniref:glycosyltransferase family 2 protein n=1 Tax=Halorhabdus sp. CUG00001 TaxID=2600297 RepID=UPI00131ECF5F|nr:glycosyltransferase [Halorhabdus sp. CUG00001]
MNAEAQPPSQRPTKEQSTAESYFVTADDDREPVISVVMPTLNEEGGIEECIEWTKSAFESVELPGEIVLSDSSTDRTPEIGREMGARVVEPDEGGYGYAYRYAFERARGEYIVMGDADTTYDFEELPKLLEPVRAGEADICMGSRFEGEIKDGAMPKLHQYFGNPLLTTFLNIFYHADVSDAHSGFRVFRRDVLDRLDLSADGMEFASEMVMESASRDLKIVEVPITYHEREGEATLNSFQDGWRHVKFMLVNAPGYLFSIPGAVLFGIGVALMGFALIGATFPSVRLSPVWQQGVNFGVRSAILGSLLAIVGYHVGSLGIFATVASDPIHRPDDVVTNAIVEHLSLERGAMVGLVLFGVGLGYAVVLIGRWLTSGYVALPPLTHDVIAFTLIVLGIQTVFGSFFMSTVAEG